MPGAGIPDSRVAAFRNGGKRDLDISKLHTFAFCKLGKRLRDDDVLEMRRLLMLGERGLPRENLVEKEFSGLGRILVDLKLLYAGLLLSPRKEFLQQAGDRAFLAGIDLPERRDDQA